MSGQPFSFPPPPPPPPRRTIEDQCQQNQGYQHGRGSFRGGRAYQGTVGGVRGGYSDDRSRPSPTHTNYGQRYGQNSSHKSWSDRPPRGGSFNHAQKRDHGTAFRQPQNPRPRPTAPPAVPNFNASLDHLLARKPAEQAFPTSTESTKPQNALASQKRNLLGLTPSKFEHDSDPEDDADEEKRLATQTVVLSGAHMFESNGSPVLLRTREEILAWVAERKRRYPTEARREAAKKEAEQKREQRYQATQIARKEALAKRDRERTGTLRANEESRKTRVKEKRARKVPALVDATQATLRADKLRKKALKAQKELEEAEEALRTVQARSDNVVPPFNVTEVDQVPASELPGALPQATANVQDDETSSSGSSTSDSDTDLDSDSDSAPEVTSIRHASRGPDALPRQPRKVKDRIPNLCAHFAKYKECKFGSRCRYSHDLSQKGRKTAIDDRVESQKKEGADLVSGKVRRKGLWQVMAEKEQEEERKRLLAAIISLGERGFLDEPS